MKLHLECYSCFMRQALQAARFTGADEKTQRRAILRTMEILSSAPPDATPPQMSEAIHRAIREETHSTDAYLAVKTASTAQAMALYPQLKELVQTSPNPFCMATRISVIGNMIDFAVTDELDLENDIRSDLHEPLAHDDTAFLAAELEKAPWVLYLADNAGETVFDRIFIETLNHEDLRYVVKGGPVINDALREDVLAIGLDNLVKLYDTGADAVGVVPSRSSPEFLHLLNTAPVIIAKGQANYESLSGTPYNVFFLFKVKCPMVSNATGQPIGSQMVYHENHAMP